MTRSVQTVKIPTVFRKRDYVYKALRTYKSRYTPGKFSPEKTINMASICKH